MTKRVFVVSFLLTVFFLVQAHEFWLQPKKYRYTVGEEVTVDLMVGEDFLGEYWDLTKHKVEKAEMHYPGGVTDLTNTVQIRKGKNLLYKLTKEGTHLLALRSNAAFIELEAEKFNEYLKDDGLDNILDERTNTATLDKAAKEHYQRFAKLLIQSGSKTDATFSKRANFPIEIVPLANPYTLKTGDYLECRVLYEGKPAPHQLVKVWSYVGNSTFLQNIYTENDGTLKFPLSSRGPWMVSTVKMKKSEKEGADYQSMWASLVFGIE
jgi:uncharacterized GH25 family protein